MGGAWQAHPTWQTLRDLTLLDLFPPGPFSFIFFEYICPFLRSDISSRRCSPDQLSSCDQLVPRQREREMESGDSAPWEPLSDFFMPFCHQRYGILPLGVFLSQYPQTLNFMFAFPFPTGVMTRIRADHRSRWKKFESFCTLVSRPCF